ncbi:MAG: hypothetical protein K0Q77_33 [Anaerosporomusa subterranea]|jgi:hypothetical protein|nr:hypothetical protein [Anaerosporomusa subterranea]
MDYISKGFEILLQGALASLIVLYVTMKLQQRKEHQAIRNSAILLQFEVEAHGKILAKWGKKSNTPKLQSKDLYIFIETKEWEASKNTMVNMDNSHFHTLSAYYHETKILTESCRNGMLEFVSDNTVSYQYLFSIAVLCLLKAYTYKLYSKEFKQAIIEFEETKRVIPSSYYQSPTFSD